MKRGRQHDEALLVAASITSVFLFIYWLGSGQPPASQTTTNWLTAGLVAVGALQIFMFWRQLRAMRDGLEDAAETARAAVKQADYAERTFQTIERPYVFVFDVERVMVNPLVPGGLTPFVEFSVANYGKVAAIIDHVTIFNCSNPAGTPPVGMGVDVDHPLMRRKILAPGDKVEKIKDEVCLGTFSWANDSENRARPQLPQGDTYYFSVVITYHGPFTEGHTTSAYWRLDPTTNHFVEVGGVKLNYAK